MTENHSRGLVSRFFNYFISDSQEKRKEQEREQRKEVVEDVTKVIFGPILNWVDPDYLGKDPAKGITIRKRLIDLERELVVTDYFNSAQIRQTTKKAKQFPPLNYYPLGSYLSWVLNGGVLSPAVSTICFLTQPYEQRFPLVEAVKLKPELGKGTRDAFFRLLENVASEIEEDKADISDSVRKINPD